MIEGFSDYDKTEVKEFEEVEKITLGGHICKVLGVETEKVTSQKDGSTWNVLKIKFDIEEPDPQAGFYQRKFVDAAKKDAMNAKWKGYYRLNIPTNTSPDFAKTNWKTFITSIEKSNPGVEINGSKGFDENILIGKVFGGIFGLEEMTLPDGKLISFTRIRFARSTEKINEVKIPKVKLLDGTFVDYEEYMASKNNQQAQESTSSIDNNEFGVIDSDADLPF